MPEWKIHRYWSKKLGLTDEIAEKVDRIIDFEKEFKGFKVGHDWIRSGSIGGFELAARMFYQEFGIEGIKSMMLHGVLDYAKWLSDNRYSRDEIFWRVLAWVKFAGSKDVTSSISRGIPEKQRVNYVLERDYTYYDKYFRELAGVCKETAKEIVEFVTKNFTEILEKLGSYLT